jgi:cell wall-associated NlpC family hydrolase
VWLAAFATVGVAGVDAVVATPVARQLGLPQGNGLLIAAPHADPLQLRTRIAALTGGHARVEILRQVVTVRAAGEFLTNAQIAAVLAAAHSRLDDPYLWGGTGPDAFDCSGLVGWAFAHAGVVLPRTSEQQWLAGPHVPPVDLRPGDLLFYHYDPTDPADIDHVALYVGGGWMIEAPHTGAFVQEVTVRGGELAGIVRVDPVSAAEVGGPRFAGN